MPIYEYRCQRCGHELEVMQRITAEPLAQCPECGAEDGLKRLISQTSFVLKGSGWYVTDYKGKSASAAGGGKGPSGNDSKTNTDGGASSKPSSDAGTGSAAPKKAASGSD